MSTKPAAHQIHTIKPKAQIIRELRNAPSIPKPVSAGGRMEKEKEIAGEEKKNSTNRPKYVILALTL